MLKQHPTILLASKSPLNIHSLISVLNHEYDLKVATTPHVAMKIIFSNDPPDLILLDSDMAGPNEICICSHLRESHKTNSIPLIILSNNPDEQTKAFLMGAADFIVKPYNNIVLKAKVNTHAHLRVRTKLLEKLASIDGLTGIPNRRYFNNRLHEEFKRGQRSKQKLSLIIVDIDFFKLFNDTYGHGAGDDCLRQVAQMLKSILQRPGDLSARYGGEEFVFLLPDTDYIGAMHIAEKLVAGIQSLKIAHEKSTVSKFVSISAGFATSDYSIDNLPESILERADQALYNAKNSGRNQAK
jgi:diguanylate cyclase (GGDEF)-like protein